ncbi:3-phosphoserine/phosphohydroxythreonine transaminase [Paenibacillus sp. MBLB4367]|uniref:3-phosphoserine/phosphohydroxythreonine transaminase n=1 Tax=Paenibacillus sp. MBLB4367 TaxID=3384767 RepID=UPI0039083AE8
MTRRVYNFNPGPAALPLPVLERAQAEFVSIQGFGMSVMEMSHRSAYVEELNEETQRLLLELLGITGGYRVLFMGGGASTQFALLPLNFLPPDKTAHYVLSGSFSEKAYLEAKYIGHTRIAASSKEQGWRRIPDMSGLQLDADAAYLHVTTNNTIEGSRYNALPDTGAVPLIADMTSDLLSRRMDMRKIAMAYAGAQKNLGPAGVTAVIVKEELLERASSHIPVILRYETFAKEKSLYNTPPVHAIYMMNLMLKWVAEQGGVKALESRNAEKASLLYDTIDASGGFYKGIVNEGDRSDMNITWKMADEALERRFIQTSAKYGFEGLSGHRSVGGLRASAYNGVPLEACQALADFMAEFQRTNG